MTALRVTRRAIQDDIVARLRAVAGVENVYTEYQYARSQPDFLEKFVEADEDRIQTWVVRRIETIAHTSSSAPDMPIPMGCDVWYEHLFRIEMYYGYKIAESEDEYQDLIDAVLDAFKEVRTYASATADAITDRPLSMSDELETASLHGVFVHKATFEVPILDRHHELEPV